MQFHERLSELMQSRGYSNYRLAQLLNMSQSTVAYWLDGKGTPQRSKQKQLSELFGVSIGYLMGDDEKENAPISNDEDELIEILQALRDRPEMKMLFHAGLKAKPDTVRETAKFLEGLAKGESD